MADCGQSEHMTNIFSVTCCSLNYTVDQDLFVCVNVNFCFLYGCSLPLISLPVVHGLLTVLTLQAEQPSLSHNATSVRLTNVPSCLKSGIARK